MICKSAQKQLITRMSGGARVGAASIFAFWLTLAGAAAEPTAESFFEDFDSINTKRWRVSDGWTNGAWQNCIWSKDAVRAKDGMLALRIERIAQTKGENTEVADGDGQVEKTQAQAVEPPLSKVDDKKRRHARNFACGEIFTRARYGYGTYEARFRSDRASGVNAAFFTYIGPVTGDAHHEIDFEVLTKDPSKVSVNTHVDGVPQNGGPVPVLAGADKQFNNYAFVWEADSLRWYVNGVLYHEARDTLPSLTQRIYFSHWGTDKLTAWMGEFEYPDRPLEMLVDWVAYTAPGERCRFSESITC